MDNEYPKMVFKAGDSAAHMLGDKPLKIANKFDVQFVIVADAAEEEAMLANGWFHTPNLELEQKQKDSLAEKDDEIARLRAMLDQGQQDKQDGVIRRGPGRPPRAQEPAAEPA